MLFGTNSERRAEHEPRQGQRPAEGGRGPRERRGRPRIREHPVRDWWCRRRCWNRTRRRASARTAVCRSLATGSGCRRSSSKPAGPAALPPAAAPRPRTAATPRPETHSSRRPPPQSARPHPEPLCSPLRPEHFLAQLFCSTNTHVVFSPPLTTCHLHFATRRSGAPAILRPNGYGSRPCTFLMRRL